MSKVTDIKFSEHALKRARQRKLWKFVNKKLVYYDAKFFGLGKLILDYCVYAIEKREDKTVVTTMYRRLI